MTIILLLWLTASVPVLEWCIPNFMISFLLKVASESKSLIKFCKALYSARNNDICDQIYKKGSYTCI